MTPEEIRDAYDVLATELRDFTADEAAAIGNSQRSIGGLAEVVANPSGQTSGLANYTYNRLLRPTIDTMAANLETEGRAQAMDRYLKDELLKAKSAYEDAKNRYTVASTGGGGGTGGNNNNNNNNNNGPVTETTYGDGSKTEQQPFLEKGTITGMGHVGAETIISYADGNGGTLTSTYINMTDGEAINKFYSDHPEYNKTAHSGGNGEGNSGANLANYSGGGGGRSENQQPTIEYRAVNVQALPAQYVKERPWIVGGGYEVTLPGLGTIDLNSGETLYLSSDGRLFKNSAMGSLIQVWGR